MFIIFLFCLIQGFTEFLPISSQGHLIVFNDFFFLTQHIKLSIQEATIIAHTGSLLAVLVFYYKTVFGFFKSFRFLDRPDIDKNSFLLINLFISTIPIILCGYIFSVFFNYESNYLILIIGVTSILFGLFLFFADSFCLRIKGFNSLGYKISFYIGLFQCVALIPGVSRSGSILTIMRSLGFQRKFSVLYSNLLSVPVIFAATIYLVISNLNQFDVANFYTLTSLIILFLSFFFSFLFIFFLVSWVKRFSLSIFVIYRVVFGIFIISYFYQ